MPVGIVRRLAWMTAYLIPVFSFSWVYASNEKVISLAVQEYCPFVCLGHEPGGSYSGAHVDILKLLFADGEYVLDFKKTPFVRSLRDAEKGEIDGVLAVLKNEDREKSLYFTAPFTTTRSCFYTRRDSEWRYRGVKSLASVQLGMIRGYIYNGRVGEYLSRNELGHFVISGDNAEIRQFKLLSTGRFDALNENEAVADHIIEAYGLGERLTKAGCQSGAENNYLGISKRSEHGESFHREVSRRLVDPTFRREIAKILTSYGIETR